MSPIVADSLSVVIRGENLQKILLMTNHRQWTWSLTLMLALMLMLMSHTSLHFFVSSFVLVCTYACVASVNQAYVFIKKPNVNMEEVCLKPYMFSA